MLKKTILFFILSAFSVTLSAQKIYTPEDVFKEKNVVWYGIDFTRSKFIGQPSIHGNFYKEPGYVVKFYFKDWNLIPLKETDKYDIKGSFEKDYVYYDVDSVMERNKRYDSDSLISITNRHNLNTAEIPGMISKYGGVAKEGIGIAYIVETFNHETDIASFYVVVFDIASKKILFQENITGQAHGGSVKTFWAGAFHEVLEKTHKVYRKWKKETMVK